MATYGLSGPASASNTRRVIASFPGQAAGSYDTAATLTTSLTGTNNDLKYTAAAATSGGNDTRVRYVVSGNNTALSVSVSGSDITVNVATDGSGNPTSTAAQVRTAVNASGPASALVSAADAPGNDGTGVVTALAYTNLTGGLSSTRGRRGSTGPRPGQHPIHDSYR